VKPQPFIAFEKAGDKKVLDSFVVPADAA